MATIDYDWQDFAFSSKKELKDLNAILIAPPRELSEKRFIQIIKAYLPKGNILLGISKGQYVDGFTGQPQFKTLQLKTVAGIIEKVNAASKVYKVRTIHLHQRELNFLIQKIDFKKILLVNGSWQHVFHGTEVFYTIVSRKIAYEYISPFSDKAEALEYETTHSAALPKPAGRLTVTEVFVVADSAAALSYDYSFQTGAVLCKKMQKSYKYLLHSFNKVVPYQTYALLHGNSREKNYSPTHDLNHYDTIHAEAMMIVEAQKQKIDLNGTSLFINLLPCPNCARILSQTDIVEIVYKIDHSDGYAIRLLEESGKKVRRVI